MVINHNFPTSTIFLWTATIQLSMLQNDSECIYFLYGKRLAAISRFQTTAISNFPPGKTFSLQMLKFIHRENDSKLLLNNNLFILNFQNMLTMIKPSYTENIAASHKIHLSFHFDWVGICDMIWKDRIMSITPHWIWHWIHVRNKLVAALRLIGVIIINGNLCDSTNLCGSTASVPMNFMNNIGHKID